MKTVRLKNIDEALPRLGLGCMGMSEFYGPVSDRGDALNLMDVAFEQGVRVFDTADFYGNGDNEKLIGEFIATYKKRPFLATKCGIVRGKEVLSDGNFRREYNGKPSYIKAACESSLRRLGVDTIDLFYLHRIDPAVPIEDSTGALADLVQAGKVRAIGLSEANADELQRANAVFPISALQSEYSIWSRHVEHELLPLCKKLDVTFVPYSPLGRGMVPAAKGQSLHFTKGDFRATLERADQNNIDKNQPLYDVLFDTAARYGISHFQVMLAWLFAQSSSLLPIPGSRKIANLLANVEAESIVLEDATLTELSALFTSKTIAGGRYTINKEVAANAAAMSDN